MLPQPDELVFVSDDGKCADDAVKLSDYVEAGLKNRKAILLRHHGMIATGPTLASAMWPAVEVETLARM